LGVLIIELLSGQTPFNEGCSQAIYDRILTGLPFIPSNVSYPSQKSLHNDIYLLSHPQVSDVAKDLVLKLLEKQPENRLGYHNDAADIKEHQFFEKINWDDIVGKKIKPPMIPQINNNLDFSQFSADFTEQPAVDSPAEPPPGPNAPRYFRGE
jgi:serine/threonine protein kinase